MLGVSSASPRKAALLAAGLLVLVLVLALGSLRAWQSAGSPGSEQASTTGRGPQSLDDEQAELPSPESVEPGSPTPEAHGQPAYCPATPRAPDADRPSLSLRFDVSDDRSTVTGSETVTFVPDLAISELVFRLWPNAAVSSHFGASLVVTSVRVGGQAAAHGYEGVGAGVGAPGTVLAVPLDAEIAAGQTVTADLDFTLRLPPAGKDRYGVSAGSAWWGSGHPMLAWVDGRGWQRDPPPRFPGEGAASEAADTRILVVAPAEDSVLTVGSAEEVTPPQDAAAGTRAWLAVNPVARDVSVAVGDLELARTTVPGIGLAPGVADGEGVPVTVGVARDAYADRTRVGAALERVTESTEASVERLSRHLGFFPYPALSVVVLPGIGAAGIEYPGSILLGTAAWEQVIPHEVAHQWFYGMIGNNQSTDPWLDEAFSTYLESMYNEARAPLLAVDTVRDPVGWPVSQFQGLYDYSLAVYTRGGGALLSARISVGGQTFDDATRCYARAHAWQVVEPADVQDAYGHLPEVIEVLNRVEALGADPAEAVSDPAGFESAVYYPEGS